MCVTADFRFGPRNMTWNCLENLRYDLKSEVIFFLRSYLTTDFLKKSAVKYIQILIYCSTFIQTNISQLQSFRDQFIFLVSNSSFFSLLAIHRHFRFPFLQFIVTYFFPSPSQKTTPDDVKIIRKCKLNIALSVMQIKHCAFGNANKTLRFQMRNVLFAFSDCFDVVWSCHRKRNVLLAFSIYACVYCN